MQGGVFGAGVYGGYFGAAQGIILMGVLGSLSSEPIQRLNGYKNVLATIVNGVAALVFILVARDQIDWLVVLLIAIGSTIGGVLGSTVGRRLPPPVLRGSHRRDRPGGDRQAPRVPLMDWPLVLLLGLAVLAGGVVQSTIGFGLAVVAAPVRRAAGPRPDAGRAPAAELRPPAAPALARRPRHRLAAARLGGGGSHPDHPGRASPSSPWFSPRAIAALVGVLILLTVAAVGVGARPAGHPAQRGRRRCRVRHLGHGRRDRWPVPRPGAAARAAASGCARRWRRSSSPARCSASPASSSGVSCRASRSSPGWSGCRSRCSATPRPARSAPGSTPTCSGATVLGFCVLASVTVIVRAALA